MNIRKESRLRNSTLNVGSNVFIYFVQIVLSFVVRTLFIRKFGQELLGLDGLLINILTMMSIAELGISSAISFSLYYPLSQKDTKKISIYMSFYRRVYRYLGFFVFVVGIIILFLLKYIVGDYHYNYLYVVYLIYLFDTVSMYFVSYKDVLLTADQKYYEVFKYDCFFKFILYILQVILLLVRPNYILYLLIMVLSRFGSRFMINRYITKKYYNVDFSVTDKLDKNEMKTFKEKVYGLFCFRVGYYVINCSDNIIISSIIGIVTVGIYTNYLSITTILKTTIKSLFNGITASFGNLSVEHNRNAERRVFGIMSFLGFFVYGYVTICLLCLINPFVELWLGEKYVLPYFSMIIICINFYLMCNQLPMDTVKEAYGFYTKDKYVPIIQAIINIILSIVLGFVLGFNGVILATTVSYLVTVFWNKPYMLYHYIFQDKCINYFFDQVKYVITLFIIYGINYYILMYIHLSVSFIHLILGGVIISIVYIFVVSLVYHKREEYQFLFNFIKGFLKK